MFILPLSKISGCKSSGYNVRTEAAYIISVIFALLSVSVTEISAQDQFFTSSQLQHANKCNKTKIEDLDHIALSQQESDVMTRAIVTLFDMYKHNMTITEEGLTRLLKNVGLIVETNHHDDDDDDDDHDDHEHKKKKRDLSTHDQCPIVDNIKDSFVCDNETFLLTLTEFATILPQIVLDKITQEPCMVEDSKEHQEPLSAKPEENTLTVWLIALSSVALISLLSVIGLLTVPMMKYSKYYDRFMAGLISMAIGTLIGDAILHLIPHASSEMHGSEEEHNHGVDVILKHLMIIVGIYGFFIFETLMNVYRIKKEKKIDKRERLKTSIEIAKEFNQSQQQLAVFHQRTGVVLPSAALPDQIEEEGDERTRIDLGRDCEQVNNDDERMEVSTQRIGETPGCSTNHHHGNVFKQNSNGGSIMDMAWMVIAGDGLHNFSDGLAIGAAFSSTIAAGLSTSVAIFFHELPHELGDFALLIKSGMSIKQALAYNVVCACLAFVGTIIGLLIGEYTTDFKLWVLALTAGSFLYVALVNMLPGVIKISSDTSDKWRILIIQLGLVSGIVIMLFIAMYESSFQLLFDF